VGKGVSGVRVRGRTPPLLPRPGDQGGWRRCDPSSGPGSGTPTGRAGNCARPAHVPSQVQGRGQTTVRVTEKSNIAHPELGAGGALLLLADAGHVRPGDRPVRAAGVAVGGDAVGNLDAGFDQVATDPRPEVHVVRMGRHDQDALDGAGLVKSKYGIVIGISYLTTLPNGPVPTLTADRRQAEVQTASQWGTNGRRHGARSSCRREERSSSCPSAPPACHRPSAVGCARRPRQIAKDARPARRSARNPLCEEHISLGPGPAHGHA